MFRNLGAAAAMTLALALPARAAPFRFEAEASLDEMQALVKRDLSAGMPRDQVRAMFVDSGGATLKAHPNRAGVEKYIYDINLCSYYVWRWNISADYDAKGGLKQVYVNGVPALGGALPAKLPAKGPFFKMDRPRPEAIKGEKSLAAIVAGDPRASVDVQLLTGLGPTRADPINMGRAFPYTGDLWRSIFDPDDAKVIVPYAGDCAAVDAEFARKQTQRP